MPAFSDTKKASILGKYGERCAYCGKQLTLRRMTIDHIKCRHSGGGDKLSNLNPACKDCNDKKGDLSVSEFREVAETLHAAGKYQLFFPNRKQKKFDFYYSHYLAEKQKASGKTSDETKGKRGSAAKPTNAPAKEHETAEAVKQAEPAEPAESAGWLDESMLDPYDDPYVFRESILQDGFNDRTAFNRNIVAERRREALLNQYCSDYDESIFSVLIENSGNGQPRYDISKMDDPSLLRLVEKLKKIPGITQTSLLRIQNEYILGNLARMDNHANQMNPNNPSAKGSSKETANTSKK